MKALRGLATDQKMVAMRDKLFQEFDDAKRQLKDQYTLEFGRMRAEYRDALEDTKLYHKEEIEKLKAAIIKQKDVYENDKQRCLQQMASRRRFSQDVTRCKHCLSGCNNESGSATPGQIKEVIEDYERQLALCRKTINEQKVTYENRLAEEKGKLQDAFMQEKVALEELAFKQLNLKLEKELKWRDLLLLEQNILSNAYETSLHVRDKDGDSGFEVESCTKNAEGVIDNKPDDDISQLRKAMLDSFAAERQHIAKEHERALEELRVALSKEGQKTIMRERKIHKRTIEQLHIDFELLREENKKLKELLNVECDQYTLATELSGVVLDMKQQILALQSQLEQCGPTRGD